MSQLKVVLWEAVRVNEEAMVRVLSDLLGVDPRKAVAGRPTTSEQEAHTRGHTDVVATFNKNAPPAKLTAEEQHIMRAMKVFRGAVGNGLIGSSRTFRLLIYMN